MLKCEFHCHAKEDKMDHIPFSYRELFSVAKKKGYGFLALTFHNNVFFNSDVKYFAKKNNIITCPAVEANIDGGDVLIFNITQSEYKKIKDFEDLNDFFCIAAHPFYPVGRCLRDNAIKHNDIFDAVELSSVHAPGLNRWNNMAKDFARKIDVPLVATSDCHRIWQLDKSFTLVDSSSNKAEDIFEAVRKRKCRAVQTKGSYFDLSRFVARTVFEDLTNIVMKRKTYLFNKTI